MEWQKRKQLSGLLQVVEQEVEQADTAAGILTGFTAQEAQDS